LAIRGKVFLQAACLRFSRYCGWVSSLGRDFRWLKDVLNNHREDCYLADLV